MYIKTKSLSQEIGSFPHFSNLQKIKNPRRCSYPLER